jgi:hypothetical protein
MRYSVLILALLTCIQAPPPPPSFSGSWDLDPSRSVVHGGSAGIELVVVEGSDRLAVEFRRRFLSES